MCEVQTKLVAWLDCELPADEAASVERHIEECEECRNKLAKYKHVSETFDVYCDAVIAAGSRHRISRWVPVLASAAVAAVIMFLVFHRTRVVPSAVLTPAITAVSVPDPDPVPKPKLAVRKNVHRPRAVPVVRERVATWQPMETAVQIAIPAEAMFPPGAMPNGMNFVAELSIAQDGSVKQVRLRQ